MKTHFGVDGRPINVRDGGYAKVTWTYDGRGDLLEESYFGADGKPAHDDGCVTIKYVYDDEGRPTRVAYLDAQSHELHMELVVQRVIPGGFGAISGLAPDDHILAYNGQQVNSVKQLTDLTTSGTFPFRTMTVRRGAKIITLQVARGRLGVWIGFARVGAHEAAAGPTSPSPVPSR